MPSAFLNLVIYYMKEELETDRDIHESFQSSVICVFSPLNTSHGLKGNLTDEDRTSFEFNTGQ